ncbi:GspH/FimT family pseudopilin [Pseudomonas sp. NY11955]|uniref:GspH/FimT family pseudopilin n=1 Tax=Pseudomonas sp. NY11955 TaxID=3400363 RepID=UPI003A868424
MKQRGVTLIQILSGLAVAVLLTQLGVPAYAKLSGDLHRAVTARDLAQALRNARSHAVLQGQTVVVVALDGHWGNGWRSLLEHNQQVLREHRLSRPMKIATNTGGQVKFSAQGVPMQPNNAQLSGRLVVCEKTNSPYHVVLASSGRVALRTDEPNHPLCARP